MNAVTKKVYLNVILENGGGTTYPIKEYYQFGPKVIMYLVDGTKKIINDVIGCEVITIGPIKRNY
jgi:hypothetical protein